mmetsp:Transcript_17572/g.40573  ORF Transcript_17572/g.40573 Transcript_17572/m.40573 type:complete len:231 (-) Transcript_17572:314-1006(-)
MLGARIGALSRTACCARRATTGTGSTARWTRRTQSRLTGRRGSACLTSATSPKTRGASCRSMASRPPAGRTGAASPASCCAWRATTVSGSTARSRRRHARRRPPDPPKSAPTTCVPNPTTAKSTSRSTATPLRAGRTGACWTATHCASRATCGSRTAGRWSATSPCRTLSGGAPSRGATSPMTAASSSRSTPRARRGGTTGPPSAARSCARSATTDTSSAGRWSASTRQH